MPPAPPSRALTITNPLILYRALLATQQIHPDPSQHRLAIHLQKLYHRLKDYEPAINFSHRISQLNRVAGKSTSTATNGVARPPQQQQNDAPSSPRQRRGIFASLQAQKEKTEATALTRKLTEPESAIEAPSPRGLLLYGEVGTGKSLLVDLLADSLPTRKKRRWHFNNFMLEVFARIESLRRRRVENDGGSMLVSDEHSLLALAREMIATSPILFLDEFQIPDRAAAKILSSLLTSFFYLGGVLVATSNRLPEELAAAAGVEFAMPPRVGRGGWNWWKRGAQDAAGGGMFAGRGDMAAFLEVLKARCEVWDMEGGKDWRRHEAGDEAVLNEDPVVDSELVHEQHLDGLEPMAAGNLGLGYEQSVHTISQSESLLSTARAPKTSSSASTPKNYFILPPSPTTDLSFPLEFHLRELSAVYPSSPSSTLTAPLPWTTTTTLTIYARPLPIPLHHNGVTKWTFNALCATPLGPADYITLASTYHTFIITSVPILTLALKNEARRFITLLDALYECRCKLLLSAEAGPDELFFPELKPRSPETQNQNQPQTQNGSGIENSNSEGLDPLHPETFAEIYQDAHFPFRPNTASTYTPSASPPSYTPTTSSPHATTRSILADEDSDFGPVLGRHSPSSPASSPPGAAPSPSSEVEGGRGKGDGGAKPLDFTQATPFTGEDERFAYARAASRLWEVCGGRWWARGGGSTASNSTLASSSPSPSLSSSNQPEEDATNPSWWRPLPPHSRPWETTATATPSLLVPTTATISTSTVSATGDDAHASARAHTQIHTHADEATTSTSPFRTSTEPPPKFSEVHAWGVVTWGRKAGLWGKGVEGLEGRKGGRGKNGTEGGWKGKGEDDGKGGEGKKGKENR